MSSHTFKTFNGNSWVEAMRIDSSGNIGIGSIGTSTKSHSSINQYEEWVDILKLAETHPAVSSALEKLRTTYYLSRENGRSET
jgi:hypothetical protein